MYIFRLTATHVAYQRVKRFLDAKYEFLDCLLSQLET